ncbi:O-antigen ligase family protein [Fictibacillus phosphorivorans]|uniref:O-antigen ligase family protein n=1 Tax=Fictibacillus phosphorivorans TaxID=1221500 RepID=UPI0035E4A245
MTSILTAKRKYSLETSLVLCFILPPAGIFLLLLIGSCFLHRTCREGRRINLTVGHFLLSCMFLSTIGSAIVMQDYSYFLISAMILAYLGLYLKIMNDGILRIFVAFKWITICGGLYYYVLYPFQHILVEQPIMSYIVGTALVGPFNLENIQRLRGAAYNPNFTVTLLLLGLSFLLAESLKSLRKSAYLTLCMQLLVTGLFIHAIFLTGSKAGFSIMLIILMLTVFRWSRMLSFHFACLLAANIPMLIGLMPRSAQLWASADTRKVIWEHSFHLWQEQSLFGMTPIGFYKEYFYFYHAKLPHAHNMVLGMFTEYGALGGIAFLIVVIINIYKVLSLYCLKQTNKEHLDVFLLSLPVILLTGIFDYVLYSPQVAVIAIILLASWDKYTARISLVNPLVISYVKKWPWTLLLKNSKNRESVK